MKSNKLHIWSRLLEQDGWRSVPEVLKRWRPPAPDSLPGHDVQHRIAKCCHVERFRFLQEISAQEYLFLNKSDQVSFIAIRIWALWGSDYERLWCPQGELVAGSCWQEVQMSGSRLFGLACQGKIEDMLCLVWRYLKQQLCSFFKLPGVVEKVKVA